MNSEWRKSTYSGGSSNACVEVAANGTVLVRDTTNRDGGTLTVTAAAWSTFTSAIK
jgi:hypothetical protein